MYIDRNYVTNRLINSGFVKPTGVDYCVDMILEFYLLYDVDINEAIDCLLNPKPTKLKSMLLDMYDNDNKYNSV